MTPRLGRAEPTTRGNSNWGHPAPRTSRPISGRDQRPEDPEPGNTEQDTTRPGTGSTAPAPRDCISQRIPPSCVTLSPPVATRRSPAPPSRGYRARGKGAGKRVTPWDETLWDKMRARPEPGEIPPGHQGESINGEPQAPLSSRRGECWGALGTAGSGITLSLRPPTPLHIRHPVGAGCGSRCPVSRREPRGGGSCPLKPSRCGCTPNPGVALSRISPHPAGS